MRIHQIDVHKMYWLAKTTTNVSCALFEHFFKVDEWWLIINTKHHVIQMYLLVVFLLLFLSLFDPCKLYQLLNSK